MGLKISLIRSVSLVVFMAVVLLTAAENVFAQCGGGTSCTAALGSTACPADFNTTGNIASLAAQATEEDCTGSANQSNSATSTPQLGGTAPAGLTHCQSYNTDPIRDVYESLNPIGNGFDSSDLRFFRVGCDTNWCYWEWEQVATWTNATSSSHNFYTMLDIDRAAETSPIARYDLFVAYTPQNSHLGSSWCAEGNAQVTMFEDVNNDAGGSSLGSEFPSASDQFTTQVVLPLADAYARLVTIAGIARPQIAIRRTAIPTNPTLIRSNACVFQNSSLSKDKYPWHDEQSVTDLGTVGDNTSGQTFDCLCGTNTGTCPESGTNPTPVTLSYFHASSGGGGIEFDWSTATEVGNVGFNLYVDTEAGWEKINEELIAAKGGDSLVPQDYSYTGAGAAGDTFLIADVDIRGVERRHGPFSLGESYGRRTVVVPIDWAGIGTEHADKRVKSLQTLRASVRAQGLINSKFELRLEEDGIYRVTYEQLKAAGMDLNGVAANKIALTNRGVSVPIYVKSNGSTFGAGGYIEFYGEGLDTLYTKTNVYTLQVNQSLAKRVSSDTKLPSGVPVISYRETVEVDENLQYGFASPNGDPWYDTRFLAYTSPVSQSYSLNVDKLASSSNAVLFVNLWGVTNWPDDDEDHHVVVELNGTQVADKYFNGLVEVALSIPLSSGLLKEGENVLKITLPGDSGVAFEVVNLDSYGASYSRSFRARDGGLSFMGSGNSFRVDGLPSANVVAYRIESGKVTRLSGIRVTGTGTERSASFPGTRKNALYVVSTVESLETASITPARLPMPIRALAGTDYLIVSHPSFIDGLQGLIDAREADGLNVTVVNVEDVYNQYSYGIFDPQAIRDYVRFAGNSGVEYVLLVGGDTYDYFDYLGLGSISFIPTLYAKTHEVVYYSPSDTLFVDFDNDNVPDIPIGRLPVRTGAELASVIDKILGYSGAGHGGTAVFAADRDFSKETDDFAALVPGGWSVGTAYVDELGIDGAKAELVAAVNDGRALTSFFGHSGPTVWSLENLFSAADAGALTNAGKPTVIVQWGCWNTYHVAPTYDTMGHAFLLSGDRGAAAVLGAASLTEKSSEELLGGLVYEKLFEPGQTIGGAVQEAKSELALTHPELLDVLIGWTLLGDPAMSVLP